MGFAINTAPMQVIASGTVAVSEEKSEALVLDEATLEGAALERSVDRRDEHSVAHRHTRRANGELARSGPDVGHRVDRGLAHTGPTWPGRQCARSVRARARRPPNENQMSQVGRAGVVQRRREWR